MLPQATRGNAAATSHYARGARQPRRRAYAPSRARSRARPRAARSGHQPPYPSTTPRHTHTPPRAPQSSLGGSKLGAAGGGSSALARSTARLGAGAAKGGARKPAAAALDTEQLEELKEAFNLFDTDSNGQIDAKELKAAMRALGFQVKKADVRKMIADIDKEEFINFDDFKDIMTGRMGDRDSKEEIAKVFALFDHEGSGKISFRDLKRVVTELGENIPDDEMREMIEEADKDQDGFVVFEDFYKILKKGDDDDDDDDFVGGRRRRARSGETLSAACSALPRASRARSRQGAAALTPAPPSPSFASAQ